MAGGDPKMQYCHLLEASRSSKNSIRERGRKTKEGNMENDFHTGDT